MRKVFFCSFICFLFIPLLARAVSFSVVPIKISLEPNKKIENLRIENLTSERITVQIRAYTWEQDKKGKDIYKPTEDLIYYPRIVTIKGKEERLIRIGYQKKFSNKEQTFRLFLEEIPDVKKSESPMLRIALRAGVPVFISPNTKKNVQGKIENIEISKGKISLTVSNKGNSHFFLKNLSISGINSGGDTIFTITKKGWYILTENSLVYSLDIPADKCEQLKAITINLETKQFNIKDTVRVDSQQCKG